MSGNVFVVVKFSTEGVSGGSGRVLVGVGMGVSGGMAACGKRGMRLGETVYDGLLENMKRKRELTVEAREEENERERERKENSNRKKKLLKGKNGWKSERERLCR